MDIKFEERLPRAEEWISLRAETDWGTHSPIDFETAAQNSLYGVCITLEGEIIGMGRVVGDKAICFYIQDIVITKAYRRMGVGRKMMGMILRWIAENAAPGADICLMSARGKENFYEKLGFQKRDGNQAGFGMFLPCNAYSSQL